MSEQTYFIRLANKNIYDENGILLQTCNVVIKFHSKESKLKMLYMLNKKEKIKYQQKYQLINREDYLDYQKDYYQRRKETILSQKKEKIVCECGRTTSLGNLTTHLKTKLHFKHKSKLELLKQSQALECSV